MLRLSASPRRSATPPRRRPPPGVMAARLAAIDSQASAFSTQNGVNFREPSVDTGAKICGIHRTVLNPAGMCRFGGRGHEVCTDGARVYFTTRNVLVHGWETDCDSYLLLCPVCRGGGPNNTISYAFRQVGGIDGDWVADAKDVRLGDLFRQSQMELNDIEGQGRYRHFQFDVFERSIRRQSAEVVEIQDDSEDDFVDMLPPTPTPVAAPATQTMDQYPPASQSDGAALRTNIPPVTPARPLEGPLAIKPLLIPGQPQPLRHPSKLTTLQKEYFLKSLVNNIALQDQGLSVLEWYGYCMEDTFLNVGGWLKGPKAAADRIRLERRPRRAVEGEQTGRAEVTLPTDYATDQLEDAIKAREEVREATVARAVQTAVRQNNDRDFIANNRTSIMINTVAATPSNRGTYQIFANAEGVLTGLTPEEQIRTARG